MRYRKAVGFQYLVVFVVVVMSTLQKTILKAKLPPSVPIGSLGSRCVDPDFRAVKL